MRYQNSLCVRISLGKNDSKGWCFNHFGGMLTWVSTRLEISSLIHSFFFFLGWSRLVVMSEVEEGYSVVAGPLSINDFLQCYLFYIGVDLSITHFNGQWIIHLLQLWGGFLSSCLLIIIRTHGSKFSNKANQKGESWQKELFTLHSPFQEELPGKSLSQRKQVLFGLDLRKSK